ALQQTRMSSLFTCFLTSPPPPSATLFPYTTLFRSRPPVPGRSGCPAATTSAPPPPASGRGARPGPRTAGRPASTSRLPASSATRSEEHTSELQSRENLVCRLLLEKKNCNSSLSATN